MLSGPKLARIFPGPNEAPEVELAFLLAWKEMLGSMAFVVTKFFNKRNLELLSSISDRCQQVLQLLW